MLSVCLPHFERSQQPGLTRETMLKDCTVQMCDMLTECACKSPPAPACSSGFQSATLPSSAAAGWCPDHLLMPRIDYKAKQVCCTPPMLDARRWHTSYGLLEAIGHQLPYNRGMQQPALYWDTGHAYTPTATPASRMPGTTCTTLLRDVHAYRQQ